MVLKGFCKNNICRKDLRLQLPAELQSGVKNEKFSL